MSNTTLTNNNGAACAIPTAETNSNNTTNLTSIQQQELKTKGMIVNQDFEKAIQEMENQNRLNILNQKQAERKNREQEQIEHIQAIIVAEKLQKESQHIPLEEFQKEIQQIPLINRTDDDCEFKKLNEKLIDILSIIVVFSVLNKRLSTGDKTARILKSEFANALAIRKTLSFSSIPVEGKKYSLSDAIAIYQEAYIYLWDMIVNKNHSYDDKITIQLKTKEKEKTVFQHAFSIAGRYIREQASNDIFNKSITYTTVIDKDGNRQVRGSGTRILKTDRVIEKNVHRTIGYVYIEDLSQGDETANEVLDKEYIKISACGIGSLNEHGDFIGADITAFDNILESCGITKHQKQAIKLRLMGYSIEKIALKLDITHQAVSDRLTNAQEKIKKCYPQLIRHFIK